MDKNKILVVDDDKDVADMVEFYLKNENMDVIKAYDGIEAMNILKNNAVDLIILDIMMPKLDGLNTCMKIREEMNMPIIMLSAKIDSLDKVLGLTTGADDYVGKPFNPLELIARVKSQMRRYKRLNISEEKIENNEDLLALGDLSVNVATHEVKYNDQQIKLTPHEFDILHLLAKNRGRVFSIKQLYEAVWQEPYCEFDRTVTVHIRRLRQKIEPNDQNPQYIKTVWGVGYKIEN
ncbi:MAG: response regulator transcription factor [Bacillota bacterium]|nr:response regulator transcription factor [Bacillota bacterium]